MPRDHARAEITLNVIRDRVREVERHERSQSRIFELFSETTTGKIGFKYSIPSTGHNHGARPRQHLAVETICRSGPTRLTLKRYRLRRYFLRGG